MRAVYDIDFKYEDSSTAHFVESVVADGMTDAASKAAGLVQDRANRNDFGWRVVKIEEIRRVRED